MVDDKDRVWLNRARHDPEPVAADVDETRRSAAQRVVLPFRVRKYARNSGRVARRRMALSHHPPALPGVCLTNGSGLLPVVAACHSVSRWSHVGGAAGCDIDDLAGIVFSGLSSLVIEDVRDCWPGTCPR